MKNIPWIFITSLVLIVSAAWAAAPDDGEPDIIESNIAPVARPSIEEEKRFTDPDEANASSAMAILERAPRGAYISVGTERGFVGASLSPGVDRFILVDVDEKAVRFNRVNTALLRVSTDRTDYLDLRLKGKLEDWKKRAKAEGVDAETATVLQDAESFKWWKRVVRKSKDFAVMNQDLKRNFSGAFKDTYYVANDEPFMRIRKLAQAGKISAIQLDLRDSEKVKATVEKLKGEGVSLGVFDLSNAWWYLEENEVQAAIDGFRPISKPESVVLFKSNNAGAWAHYGFTFRFLSEPKHSAGYLARFKKGKFPANQLVDATEAGD